MPHIPAPATPSAWRAGLKVQVYEQHTLPGGYISSFVREGFTFPAGPSSITSNGIVFPILKELGLAEKRKFLHVGHQMNWGNTTFQRAGNSQAGSASGFFKIIVQA